MHHAPQTLRLAQRSLALAASLTDLADALCAPAAPRPWLFERPRARSVLLVKSALTVTARGQTITIEAHTPLGEDLVGALAWRFLARQSARTPATLTLRFPRPAAHCMEERLLSSTAFDVLRALSFDLAPMAGNVPTPVLLLGVVAFDHVDLLEDLPPAETDPTRFPDLLFHLAEHAIVREADGAVNALVLATGDPHPALDRLAAQAEGVHPLPAPPPAAPVTAVPDLDDPAFEALVHQCQTHIAAGDVFQIVPSRAFAAPCPDAFAAFRRLRAHAAPALFHLETAHGTLFGASPETAVRVTAKGEVEVSPIAGTRPRGRTPAEDEANAAALLACPKERAEHLMLVDLARNDVARVSAPGTRRVTRLAELHRFSHVMHIVSRVTGRLRPGLDALHVFAACMNLGTLSGAPKLMATRLIRRYEGARRGPYGGAVTLIGGDGSLDSAVIIRSALVQNGAARVRAGAGVVADSVPAAEAAETRAKALNVLRALGAAS